jgi:hypothetical protein
VKITDLIWVGTRTDRFDEMVAFVEGTLGLKAEAGDPGAVGFELWRSGAGVFRR